MSISGQTLTQVRALRATIGAEADDATRTVTADWAKGWATVAPLYATALTGLTTTAAASGTWPAPWVLARDEPLQQANRQAQTVLGGLATAAAATTVTAATNAAQATVGAEPQVLASQLPASERDGAVATFAAALTPVAVATMLASLADGVTSAPLLTTAAGAINRALVRGVRPDSGSPNALANRLLAGVQQGFMAGLTSAIGMARTDTLDAYRTTAKRVHDANGRWIDGWYWISSLDTSTCGSCWSLHGTFHPITEFGPFDHRQGRCARLAKLRPWSRLGYNRSEPDDQIPDAQARFAALPEADQLKVLGPTRLELLRSGRISWGDLAVLRRTGQRPAYLPRTVADLQSIANARSAVA